MLKNNKNLIIIASIIVIALVAVGGFMFFQKNTSSETSKDSSRVLESGPKSLTPDEVDLTLSSSPDSKKIQFTVGKANDIKAISYELTYEADPSEQDKSEGGDIRIQRGVTGEAKLKSGDSSYSSPWIDLGSCSKNVCKYDEGVTSVNLILKITKNDNKIYSVEKGLDL